MRKRRINVRMHKRRLKTGKNTIVKKHYRNLKQSEDISKNQKRLKVISNFDIQKHLWNERGSDIHREIKDYKNYMTERNQSISEKIITLEKEIMENKDNWLVEGIPKTEFINLQETLSDLRKAWRISKNLDPYLKETKIKIKPLNYFEEIDNNRFRREKVINDIHCSYFKSTFFKIDAINLTKYFRDLDLFVYYRPGKYKGNAVWRIYIDRWKTIKYREAEKAGELEIPIHFLK